MGKDTKIEWCHHTGNLWWGCVEVHEGCDHCYAKTFDRRVGGEHWGNEQPRRMIASVWKGFGDWQQAAVKAGEIHRVFVGSMMDIWERSRPTVDSKGQPTGISTAELRQRFVHEIVPSCPNLLFLLLTKRPQNILRMIPDHWIGQPPTNVIYGYSAVNQATADQGIPALLNVPGRHFLSCEPLLGPLDLTYVQFDKYTVMNVLDGCGLSTRPGYIGQTIPNAYCDPVDWVIVGGESGAHARPMHPDWARDLRDQCVAAGVPFHYKQWGEWAPGSHEAHGTHWDYVGADKFAMKKVGKHAAGRLLDGRTWDEFPTGSQSGQT